MRALSNVRALKGPERKRVLQSVEGARPELPLSAASRQLWAGIHFPAGVEKAALEAFATHAQRFTPRVSLVPPDGVLLEVKGSLKLFGGAQLLHSTIANECAALRLQAKVAMAPTPLAALAGARAGRAFILTDAAQLVGQVASLSLTTLRWPEEVLERLKQIGVRTLGAALRLPRKGFARRFGSAQLDCLDRLTGRQADPRCDFQPLERFRKRVDFEYELTRHEAILAALQPLLKELGAFLEARQLGVMRLDCWLRHRRAPATRCTVQLAASSADPHHITSLLGERLSSLQLPAPVLACALKSGPLLSRAQVSRSLWAAGEKGSEGAGVQSAALIERLAARLGSNVVSRLGLVAGHCPEKAWYSVAPMAQGGRHCLSVPWAAFRRPLWLLDTPELLPERAGLPEREGPLRLGGESERIESDWWSGEPAARDYYTAIDRTGAKLWIYREREKPHRWYLHGIFG